MKKTELSISFDKEKLSALKRYMGKKELNLEDELADTVVKLYEKYVPAPVREYIEECAAMDAAPAPARYKRREKPDELAQHHYENTEVQE